MTNQIQSLEDLQSLFIDISCLTTELKSNKLFDVRFVRHVNVLLKRVETIKFDDLRVSREEFASALFKMHIQMNSFSKDQIFLEQLEKEIIQNACALRELLRQGSLSVVIGAGVSNRFNARLEATTFTLKRSIQDLLERHNYSNYQRENQSQIDRELA